jgi:transposase
MRKAIPPIAERVADLKQRLQREHDGRKKPRLQMLYLLASGHAPTRQEVAHLLGVSRNTVGRWVALYETGGMTALLTRYKPAGKHSSLAPEILAGIAEALRSQRALAPTKNCGSGWSVPIMCKSSAKTLSTIVRKRFQAKLKVARPSHTKKPEAVANFQTDCTDHVRAAIPLDTTRPVKVFSQDESRFGLLTVRRRRLTARGVPPLVLQF